MHSIYRLTNKLVFCLFLSSIALGVGSASALSPEFEADRLLLLSEEAINHNRFASAQQSLNEIDKLKLTPPIKYYYLRGLVLANENRSLEAIGALEQYVESSGKNAEYYYAALSLISEQKDKLLSPTSSENMEGKKAELNWSTHDSQADSYSHQIKYLYQTKDVRSALVMHINNILETYTTADTGLAHNRYNIGVSNQGKLTTTTKSIEQNVEQVLSDTTVVYGIDPYIQHSCAAAAKRCTLFHPVTKQPWLQISDDQQAARELSKALAELIKILQGNS